MNQEEQQPQNDALKMRIEQVLSEILSDKYDCDIKIRFVKKDAAEKRERS